jgi:hypothetical protein
MIYCIVFLNTLKAGRLEAEATASWGMENIFCKAYSVAVNK